METEEKCPSSSAADLTPLVSVALCTYNGERFLADQLDSILAQDHTHLEVIAIDDSSQDGTWAILRDYAERDSRLRAFRNESNLGHVRNFERALTLCCGTFVAPADQDDVWKPNKLSRLLAAISCHSAVYCDSALIDEFGRGLSKRVSERLRRYSGRDPSVFTFFNCAPGHAMLLKRDAVERALPFPDVEAHDWWLAFVAASLDGITYLDEALVLFRRHEAAATNLGREKAQRRIRNERVDFERRKRHLAALQTFPGPHQSYFKKLFHAWDARLRGSFSASVLWLLFCKRHTVFFIRDSGPVLRLKKILTHSRGIRG